jgi:hypothetical protein
LDVKSGCLREKFSRAIQQSEHKLLLNLDRS